MGGAKRKYLQCFLTALTSGSRIGSESKQQMGKYLVRSERNRLVASYTRYNAQAGLEDADHDVVRQGVPLILNNVSICKADKHELLLNF